MPESLLNVLYIVCPTVGFLPQIWTRKILFSPLLSLLIIFCNILKVFHYNYKQFNIVILYQSIMLIGLHFYLIKNYNSPLSPLELRVFTPKMYMKHGLLKCALAFIISFVFMINFINIFGLGYVFGNFACVFDLFITALQLVIYKNNENKPLELFVIWVIGDIAKALSMLLVYKAPLEYVVTVVLQMAMNIIVILQ
jgi:hypothetical protein